MNIQMRWLVRGRKRVLQFRTAEIFPWWGDWKDVEEVQGASDDR